MINKTVLLSSLGLATFLVAGFLVFRLGSFDNLSDNNKPRFVAQLQIENLEEDKVERQEVKKEEVKKAQPKSIIKPIPKNDFSPPIVKPPPPSPIDSNKKETEQEDPKTVNKKSPPANKPPPPPKNEVKCSFATNQSATKPPVIINEIAWMGSKDSSNAEWIELKNLSENNFDINDWWLIDKKEQINIKFKKGETISSKGFYILERSSDKSAPQVKADKIYTGALSNHDEGLRLFNENCELIDEILAFSGWATGDNTLKRTMERGKNLTWHTSVNIGGTPKKENTIPSVPPPPNIPPPPPPASPPPTSPPPPTNPPPPPNPDINKLVISEIQITGGAGKTTNDFIEIYNPTNNTIDISKLKLKKRTKSGSESSIKVLSSGSSIPANGFFLWANSKNGFADSVSADQKSTVSISINTSIALTDSDEKVIDSVAWGEGLTNPFGEGSAITILLDANQSLERKAFQNGCISAQGSGENLGNGCDTNNNQSDFELRTISKPQNSSSNKEP